MNYKIGDKIYVKTFFSNVFTAEIISEKKWLFWKKYFCEWTVNDYEGYNGKRVGFLYPWNIININ